LSSTDILRTSGGFQMRTSAIFCAKNFGSFKIYSVSSRTRGRRGWASADEGEGSIFRVFVRASFMDSLLFFYAAA